MPIQYSGVVDEYQTVRTKAGLFDVSHMGRIAVSGSGAESFLQRVTTNDLATLKPLHAQYSMVCNPQGGILDDIFVYRLESPGEFLLCVNASNRAKILAWLLQQGQGLGDCRIQDRSTELAQIALQGPAARSVVESLGLAALVPLKLRQSTRVQVGGVECLAARTGYTGEFGYEFYVTGDASVVWDTFLGAGTAFGLKPAGLGARDLLRLEMGYLLYGNDIDEHRTPVEAGVGWAVSFTKGQFLGKAVLEEQQQAGPTRRLVGFELVDKGVPRHGFTIRSSASDPIGEVTSGNLSPLLQKGIGLGYVRSEYAKPETGIMIDIRGKLVAAKIVKPPFYKKSKS
jgi:aminomethyltransferase